MVDGTLDWANSGLLLLDDRLSVNLVAEGIIALGNEYAREFISGSPLVQICGFLTPSVPMAASAFWINSC
jgi:hypothetical protein